jgi:ACS family tartrate transporter-like MFS transporter
MSDHRDLFAKVARRLIPLMVALYTVAFLDRVNLGFAALTMNKDLSFTPEIYGWGAGIFFLGYFLFEVPSNVVLTRVGARRWICRIMATWSLVSAATAFVQGPTSFYLLRFTLGLAEAGFAPGMIYYLSLWFPAALRARYAASYFIAIPLTSVIGGPLSSVILGMDGTLGLHGWQWLFLVEALPALVLGVVVYLVLPDGPQDAPWLRNDERATIAATLAAEKERGQDHVRELWASLADARVLLLCAVYFAIVVGLYGITYWLPQIVHMMGFSNTQTGYAIVVPYGVASIMMVVWGRHSDATGERVWHVALACLVSAAAFVVSAISPSPLVVFLALSIAAIGICATLAPFWAMPPLFLTGTGAAAGIALINAVGNLGGSIGPFLVGWALQETGSYAGGMAMLSLSMIAGAALVLAMGRFRRLIFAAP